MKYYNPLPYTEKKDYTKTNTKYRFKKDKDTQRKISIHLFVQYEGDDFEMARVARELLASILAPGEEDGMHRIMVLEGEAMIIQTAITDTPEMKGHLFDALSSLSFDSSLKISGVLVSPETF